MTGTAATPPAAARGGRWFALAAFGLLVACTQLLWLSLAPVTEQARHALHVSSGAIGDLAVLNPLLYVVLAIPAGRWTDRAFSRALAAGAVLVAAGALVRAVRPGSFAWILVGQVVLSAGQPLGINAITKVAARYFAPRERIAAVSVGSAAQFVGILAAAATGEYLVRAGGLALLLGVHAAVAVAGATAMLGSLLIPPAFPVDATGRQPLSWLRRHRLVWVLAGLLFIGMGTFNALATWLDTILTGFGHGGVAGALIAVCTVSGIAGAAVLPSLVVAHDRRRTLLLIVVTVLALGALAVVHDVVFVGFALAVTGFLLLACLPVALDWSELDVGAERAATAAGVLFLAGNLGGVVFVLLVQAVVGNPYRALGLMALLAAPGIAVALRLPARVRSGPSGDRLVAEGGTS
jgi:predicted MFS family arabinose efflux permease